MDDRMTVVHSSGMTAVTRDDKMYNVYHNDDYLAVSVKTEKKPAFWTIDNLMELPVWMRTS
jgi:hypothetical protein